MGLGTGALPRRSSCRSQGRPLTEGESDPRSLLGRAVGGGEKRGLHGPGRGRFLGSLALGRLQADLLIGSVDADSASAPGRTGCRSEAAQCEWTGEKHPPQGAWNSWGRRDTGGCVAASLCCSLSQRCLLSCCTPIQKKKCCVCEVFLSGTVWPRGKFTNSSPGT